MTFCFENTRALVYLADAAPPNSGKVVKISEILEMRENKTHNWKKVAKIYNHEDFVAGTNKLTTKKNAVSFAWPKVVDPVWLKCTEGAFKNKARVCRKSSFRVSESFLRQSVHPLSLIHI